jgi:catechol 2,3-dioxygenase-like lactoylglutathione lyase family enzyme
VPAPCRCGQTDMIDHIGFTVSDYARSKDFYLRVLKPLGFGLVMEVTAEQSGAGNHAGFGPPGKPSFWISDGEPIKGRLHIAFMADSPAEVDDFYFAAIGAGAIDKGEPGLRPHYHPHYYGAFVLDPDGHNVEAVCHHG